MRRAITAKLKGSTVWVLSTQARRPPLFVSEWTGLHLKQKLLDYFGGGTVFEKPQTGEVFAWHPNQPPGSSYTARGRSDLLRALGKGGRRR